MRINTKKLFQLVSNCSHVRWFIWCQLSSLTSYHVKSPLQFKTCFLYRHTQRRSSVSRIHSRSFVFFVIFYYCFYFIQQWTLKSELKIISMWLFTNPISLYRPLKHKHVWSVWEWEKFFILWCTNFSHTHTLNSSDVNEYLLMLFFLSIEIFIQNNSSFNAVQPRYGRRAFFALGNSAGEIFLCTKIIVITNFLLQHILLSYFHVVLICALISISKKICDFASELVSSYIQTDNNPCQGQINKH